MTGTQFDAKRKPLRGNRELTNRRLSHDGAIGSLRRRPVEI